MRIAVPAARLAVALLLAAVASSCASSGRSIGEGAGGGLPRLVLLSVNVPGDGLFGTREEWTADIRRALEETEACTAVATEAEAAVGGADVRLVVDIEPAPADPPAVDVQGALLDFLAWSTVPPLPLWIADVTVDPGVEVRARAEGLAEEKDLPLGEGEASCPAIRTSHRDRFPFVSWPTLGAIVLPPFVFREPDPAHLGRSIASDVRREVAAGIARRMKGAPRRQELIGEAEIEAGGDGELFLRYAADRLLEKLDLRVEQASPPMARRAAPLSIGYGEAKVRRIRLGALLAGLDGDGRLLRIEALGRDGRRSRYTVALPPGDPAEAEEAPK